MEDGTGKAFRPARGPSIRECEATGGCFMPSIALQVRDSFWMLGALTQIRDS